LVAPDKFKGSLTAAEVAEAVGRGIRAVLPDLAVRAVPLADGGDGTVAAALAAGFRRVDVAAHGPTGEPVTAAIAVRDGTAIIETAAACGLARLPGGRPAPLDASSGGAGDLVRAALDEGCRTVVLGVGGSASTDGGAGMVAALGAALLDGAGRPIAPGGQGLADIATVGLSTLDSRLAGTEVILAADVASPLLGPGGAAAVFGPQKGANPEQVQILERNLTHWSEVVGPELAMAPAAGAAGGIGFAALAILHARRRSGIEMLLELTGFADQLTGASLVVTGEGSLDEQTLQGKTPVGVAAAARAAGVPVVAVAGRCLLDERQLAEAGIAAGYALLDLEPDVTRCIANAGPLTERVGAAIARDWLTEKVTR
jgi:glycerate kinase